MGDIYCIMNHKKVKCSDNIRGLQAEANREYEDENRYRNKVDLSKSHQNVTLVHSDDWRKSIHDAIAEAGLSADKDSVLAISTVYTASPEWFESHPDKQEQIAYFKACLAFHEMRFGKVFNAKIHFDETTPHMQLVSVPILEAPKVKNYWVCKEDGKEVKSDDKERWAKPRKRKQRKVLDDDGKPVMSIGLNGGYALGGKVKLSHLQTEFAEQVGKLHGMKRGKCRIDSDEQVENKTALQHEIEELESQKAEIFTDAEKAVEDAKAKIAEEREKLTAENNAAIHEVNIYLCEEMDVLRVSERLELDEQLADEAHEAYEQLNTELEKKRKKAESELNANIGPRIRAVYNREQAAKTTEADLDKRAVEIIMYEDYIKTLTDDFNALSDEQKKTVRARNAKEKLDKTQAYIKAEKERQIRKAAETAEDAEERERRKDMEYSL